jgi:hydroxylamine reductase
MSMFCYQCEQTANGAGCTVKGVCGKNEDIASLQDTLIFGLKGIGAYAYHARELGAKDDEVDAFMHEAMFATLTNVDFDIGRFLGLVLKCGQMNLRAMELLNNAHVKRFGEPRPAEVETGTKAGRAILVTGHDLLDLYEILKQTEGKGINVYTHGEMLPAHGYPELRKFKHLVGNFGNAWQEQRKDFDEFPGAILVTTNCVMIPKDSYRGRLFTTGIAGVEGVRHITGRDFSEVISAAQKLPALGEVPGKKIMTGFHCTAVLGSGPSSAGGGSPASGGLADKIVAAVKAGNIRRFFVIGGCDGAKAGRNYYTRLAELVPGDCVILTVACGKYRFNKMEFGAIDGIPRLIDVGQCNDAYSVIQIALALNKAFGVSVNDLPLSIVLSWFEQKAVAILLTLLSLGIKGMRIGPTPPAFITPGVFKVLQENFDLKLITTPEDDMKAMLGVLPGAQPG